MPCQTAGCAPACKLAAAHPANTGRLACAELTLWTRSQLCKSPCTLDSSARQMGLAMGAKGQQRVLTTAVRWQGPSLVSPLRAICECRLSEHSRRRPAAQQGRRRSSRASWLGLRSRRAGWQPSARPYLRSCRLLARTRQARHSCKPRCAAAGTAELPHLGLQQAAADASSDAAAAWSELN